MIAGIDDRVNVSDLISLSREYEVEWGILYDAKHSPDRKRFPSIEWINNFLFKTHGQGMNTSIHLCGKAVLDFADNEPNIMYLVQHFDRVQLNFNAKLSEKRNNLDKIVEAANSSDKQIIIQYNKQNKDYLNRFDLSKIHVLLDASGGYGRTPSSWENIGRFGAFVGYAGGIHPFNARNVLYAVSQVSTSDFWLDLESGARDDDNRFSLDKAESILKTLSHPL